MTYKLNIAGTTVDISPEAITIGNTVRARVFVSAGRRELDGAASIDMVGVIEDMEIDGNYVDFVIRTTDKLGHSVPVGFAISIDGGLMDRAIEIV